MSVIINLGDKVTFTVSVDNQSGFLYGAQQDYGDGYVVDLHSLLKGISKANLAHYVYFLTHERKPVVVDQEILIGCFEIYHITDDKNYFSHLMRQLHKFWTLLSPILYGNEVNDNVKRDIYLCCPYQVLPKSYLNNKVFFDEWLKLNFNKNFTLNDDQNFNYKKMEVEGQCSLYITYSNSHNSKVYKKIGQDDSGTQTTYNGRIEGEWDYVRQGYKTINNSVDGLPNGYCIEYNKNGQICHENYMINGDREGIGRGYYPNGKIRYEDEYQGGKIVNGCKEWYDDEQHSLRLEVFRENDSVVKTKMYYPDTDYAIILTREKYSYEDHNVKSITMFNKDNVMLWEIIYGEESQPPAKQTFYDPDKNIVEEKFFGKYWEYHYEEREWIL